MPDKSLFLVCNAHLDPVWLWEWEEGLAETLSTFRAAARFCEEFESFVFCHNEALLYRWVEEYEPELHEQIKDLASRGRWHFMGGWYVQPDCNMPSGESFVRQILAGKLYCLEAFGYEPTAAVNLDPFGHTRGLVQILLKAGYDSYLFCRPDAAHLELPGDDFLWVGYDGSEVLAHRAPDHYNSEWGKAAAKITGWLARNGGRECGLLLWGIGNHGGGPSRRDLEEINKLEAENGWRVVHGRPEDYFAVLSSRRGSLGRHEGDLNPWAVGCYTSMARVKERHRRLENLYYSTEKMLAAAAVQGLVAYPLAELRQALEDMLFCQFHDILPGSSIPEVESYALQRLDHGLEIARRLRSRAFFALLSGQPPAAEGEFPIFVFNPHPQNVEETLVCEFQPPEPNFHFNLFLAPELRDEAGEEVPHQLEKESSNINVDQRKRLVFRGRLRAGAMNRFSCRLRKAPRTQKPRRETPGALRFASAGCEVEINARTGLIDAYRVGGIDFLRPGACRPLVMKDYADPWGMRVRRFGELEGAFELLSPARSARFAGVSLAELPPVRVIEDGPVRTVVEALFGYGDSALCRRYKIPRSGAEIEVETRVFWTEKDRMLKLSLPTPFESGGCRGQVACGVEEFTRHGEELAAQKWVGVVSGDGRSALTVINDRTYGFDFAAGELRLSLLRSPAYAGHPVTDELPIVRQDRFETRIDLGERRFRFWLNAGPAAERLERVDREATVKNERPMALCCYPAGWGKPTVPGLLLSDEVVQLLALKMAERGNLLIARLFEPTGAVRKTELSIPALGLRVEVSLRPFELKTLAVDPATGEVFEVDLLERRIGGGK